VIVSRPPLDGARLFARRYPRQEPCIANAWIETDAASSSGEDVPRGLDFLFSRNRLNVAVSRAKCLAHVVANPRLLDADVRTIEQMRLVNALCRFVELA